MEAVALKARLGKAEAQPVQTRPDNYLRYKYIELGFALISLLLSAPYPLASLTPVFFFPLSSPRSPVSSSSCCHGAGAKAPRRSELEAAAAERLQRASGRAAGDGSGQEA